VVPVTRPGGGWTLADVVRVNVLPWAARERVSRHLSRWLTAELSAAADRHWRITTARGSYGPAVQRIAEDILAGLPVEDPVVVAERRAVLACTGCADVTYVDVPLGPWRTPLEADWTDAELAAAHRKSRRVGEVLTEDEAEAARAYERILKRRARHPEGVAA
jgi:hypothetical protein